MNHKNTGWMPWLSTQHHIYCYEWVRLYKSFSSALSHPSNTTHRLKNWRICHISSGTLETTMQYHLWSRDVSGYGELNHKQNRWLGRVFRTEVLLREIIERRKEEWRAEHSRERMKLHMLSGLASSAKYLEVKMAAEDWEAWTAINRTGMPQTCYTADHQKKKKKKKKNFKHGSTSEYLSSVLLLLREPYEKAE